MEANATTLGSKTRVTEIKVVIDLNILILPRGDKRTSNHASTSVVMIGEKNPGQALTGMTKVIEQTD